MTCYTISPLHKIGWSLFSRVQHEGDPCYTKLLYTTDEGIPISSRNNIRMTIVSQHVRRQPPCDKSTSRSLCHWNTRFPMTVPLTNDERFFRLTSAISILRESYELYMSTTITCRSSLMSSTAFNQFARCCLRCGSKFKSRRSKTIIVYLGVVLEQNIGSLNIYRAPTPLSQPNREKPFPHLAITSLPSFAWLKHRVEIEVLVEYHLRRRQSGI